MKRINIKTIKKIKSPKRNMEPVNESPFVEMQLIILAHEYKRERGRLQDIPLFT